MIIDANAWLGHWPFRPLSNNDPDGLLRLMDRYGIDKAVVSSLHGVFYRNCHRANEELAAAVRPHRNRLIPFGTVNPCRPGWQRHLHILHEEFGMRGLRLYPLYHGYELASGQAQELLHAAAERDLLVAIPVRIEDVRQRHWLDVERNLTVAEVEAGVRLCPQGRYIILNGIGLERATFIADVDRAGGAIVFDISRLTACVHDSMGLALRQFGAKSLVFGTGMPLNYVRPALLKMELAKVAPEDKERIYWGNLAQLLGLQP